MNTILKDGIDGTKGIINSIQEHKFRILIIQQTPCSVCNLKGGCTLSGKQDKIIETESQDTSLKVGDVVQLSCRKSIGLMAVFLAFVMPFILILITLIILNSIFPNEIISGGIALFVLVPYYLVLSLYTKRSKTKFKFEIIKENEE